MRGAVQYLMSCEAPMAVSTVVNYEPPHPGVVKRISNERYSLGSDSPKHCKNRTSVPTNLRVGRDSRSTVVHIYDRPSHLLWNTQYSEHAREWLT